MCKMTRPGIQDEKCVSSFEGKETLYICFERSITEGAEMEEMHSRDRMHVT